MSDPTSLPISKIRVGTRHRKDMGDLESLAASIRARGLYAPVLIRSDGTLLAGARRLAAAELAGLKEVDVRVLHTVKDALDALKVEQEENELRKDFTPEERVSITRELEPLLEEEALARKRSGKSIDGSAGGRGKKKPSADSADGFSEATPSERQSRAQIAAAVGMSHDTLSKAEAVVDAAEKDPETFGPIKDEMNKTGNVNGAYKKVAAAKKPPPAPPRHPYSDTILAWAEDVASQMDAVDVEIGGIEKMLAQRTKWDWKDLKSYIRPLMDEISKGLDEWKRAIDHALDQR